MDDLSQSTSVNRVAVLGFRSFLLLAILCTPLSLPWHRPWEGFKHFQRWRKVVENLFSVMRRKLYSEVFVPIAKRPLLSRLWLVLYARV